MLNLALSINGLQLVNGYSDVITPFLGMAGGYAGATGWWGNLRMFSMDRFSPPTGGRLPIQRYLSKSLLNRLTFSEREAIEKEFQGFSNGLPHDSDYSPEPDRAVEVLQSWESLKSLNEDLVTGDIRESLEKCKMAVERASQVYAKIYERGIVLDSKSRDDHVQPLRESLRHFQERAEL